MFADVAFPSKTDEGLHQPSVSWTWNLNQVVWAKKSSCKVCFGQGKSVGGASWRRARDQALVSSHWLVHQVEGELGQQWSLMRAVGTGGSYRQAQVHAVPRARNLSCVPKEASWRQWHLSPPWPLTPETRTRFPKSQPTSELWAWLLHSVMGCFLKDYS